MSFAFGEMGVGIVMDVVDNLRGGTSFADGDTGVPS